jgi:hypothetical protein
MDFTRSCLHLLVVATALFFLSTFISSNIYCIYSQNASSVVGLSLN